MPPKRFFQYNFVGGSLHSVSSKAGSDSINGHTRVETMYSFRIIRSSAVSSSIQGSGQDYGDALGDVKNLDVNTNVNN